MSNPSRDKPSEAPLNPALKSRNDTAYDTETTTPAPLETTGASEGEQGEGWSRAWLIVVVACVLLTIYFML